MAKKYKFRKVYFICEDNKVFARDYEVVNCYRREEYAMGLCVEHRRMKMDDSKKMWAKNQTVPTLNAHGFYLVHESLFEEILKQYQKS